MNLLIPNSFCFAAIGIVKSLKRFSNHQVKIIGTGEEPFAFSSGSQLVDEYIQSPLLDEKNNYEEFLNNLIVTKKIDLIICVHDLDLPILNNISKLHKNVIYVNPGEKIISLFSDKLTASVEIQKLGISVPKIFFNNADISIICRKRTSVGSQGIKRIDFKDLISFDANQTFIQENIIGEEYTIDVLCDSDGCPHLIIPRKRLEIRNGMSFKTQIVNNLLAIEITKKICSNYRIPGLWNIQFIDDGKNLYFIELNPRFAGSGIAGIVASFNYLDLFIDHFFYGKSIPPLEELQSKIVWDSIITRYYEELSSPISTS